MAHSSYKKGSPELISAHRALKGSKEQKKKMYAQNSSLERIRTHLGFSLIWLIVAKKSYICNSFLGFKTEKPKRIEKINC